MKLFVSDRSLVILRRFGFALFLAAFVIPAGHAVFLPSEKEHAHDYLQLFWGARVLMYTPQLAFALPLWRGPPIDDGFTPYEVTIRVVLLAAWSGNFLAFFRLPRIVAFGAICLPWLAYIFWFFWVAAFIPFYFWAVGIALIHLPRALKKQEPNKSAQTTPGSSTHLQV